MDLGILQETFGVLWDAFFMRTGARRASREDAPCSISIKGYIIGDSICLRTGQKSSLSQEKAATAM